MNTWQTNFAEKSRRRQLRARRRKVILPIIVIGFTSVTVLLGLSALDLILSNGLDFAGQLLDPPRRGR